MNLIELKNKYPFIERYIINMNGAEMLDIQRLKKYVNEDFQRDLKNYSGERIIDGRSISLEDEDEIING